MTATRDHDLRAVPWRDLLPMSRLEIAHEVMIYLPWLIGSIVLYGIGLIPLGMAGSFFVFLTVWTVHHGCDEHVPYRTLRNRLLNRAFCNMFLHTEHHLFPAVPTCHLYRLAKRIDCATDAYQKVLVFPSR